ncbi:testis-specific Y-encoded protein 3-like [Loxodonta africana]|uniref:testis-specific Y-encoded protein 3-like n=1 Tax=Loxodonta africana TaxID=9785 RepID=UPI0030CDDC62
MEDVKEQEKAEEQEQREKAQAKQARPSPGPSSTQRSLEALKALQLEMEPLNAKASRAYFRLRHKQVQSRKPYLDHRSAIIQGIPGFWVKIANHPQMSAMIRVEDKDMLRYLNNLKVEKLNHPNNRCKITFFFRRNPYFQNEVIYKEYDITISGYIASYSTPIQWLQGYEREAYKRRHHDTSVNFFNWFSGPSFPAYNRIAEIISEDLWINPLQYYLGEEETRTGRWREKQNAPEGQAVSCACAVSEAVVISSTPSPKLSAKVPRLGRRTPGSRISHCLPVTSPPVSRIAALLGYTGWASPEVTSGG